MLHLLQKLEWNKKYSPQLIFIRQTNHIWFLFEDCELKQEANRMISAKKKTKKNQQFTGSVFFFLQVP